MEKEKKFNTKQKIMKSAETLFSQKGYDASSIDDISKHAKTTKSLFYYYFDTKSDVLYALMKECLEYAIKDFAEKTKNNEFPKTKNELYEICINFVKEKENENIFKIALFEFLKTNKGINIITELPKEIFAEVKDIFEFSEKEQLRLILIMLKIITFRAVRKSLCENFSISEEELEKMYMENI